MDTVRSLRRSLLVLALCFFCLGLELGLWGAMVPLISHRLALTRLDISLFLLLVGVSLVAAALSFSRLLPLCNSRLLVRLVVPLYVASFTLALFAPNRELFFASALIIGLTCGLLDGAINLQAIEWERRSGRKTLSFLHGMYSLGVMFGAGYWLLAQYLGLGSAIALAPLLIAITMAICIFSSRLLDDEPAITETASAELELPWAPSLFIGLLILIVSTVEGGMIDWSALFLTHELKLHAEDAGIGVALFSICMTLGRFGGDWLAHRLKPTTLVWPGLVASILLAAAVFSKNFTLALVAYGCLGLALANAFPLLLRLFSAQLNPQARLRAIARIIGFAYFGVISGPVALGLVAEHASYAATMLCMALLMLIFTLAIASLLYRLLPGSRVAGGPED